MRTDYNPQVSYENYVRWEREGGKDLLLGANRLTNDQLFWVATTRTHYVKHHPGVPIEFRYSKRLQIEYLHVLIKNYKGFQEAFNCSMTAEEEEKLTEYSEKWKKLNSEYGDNDE